MRFLKTTKGVKLFVNVSWWKVITGVALFVVGIVFTFLYLNSQQNMFFAFLAMLTLAPGVLLAYYGASNFKISYMFNYKASAHTGKENAVIIYARKHPENNGLDQPLLIAFRYLTRVPNGARLRYFRNFRRHFYELIVNTNTHKLQDMRMPDLKYPPPREYKTPAVMPCTQEYLNYAEPTMMQKLAPGILMAVMGIVGILMVITTSGSG